MGVQHWRVSRQAGNSSELGLPADLAPELRLRPRMHLGTRGDACSHLHFIESGFVVLRQVGNEGQERVVDLLGPGDFFGEEALQPGGRWQVTAEALSPGLVRLVPGVAVPRFAQHYPNLLQKILFQLSTRIERDYRRMDLMQHPSARARAHGLLHLL
ncbi:MAG: Transcriptional Regulator, Crp/Fnr family, partial [Armatimonadetes bacterium]|nr:Transcriptional Regulator, Crp/Fnr family [Armatimonadota bacterium]